MMFDLCIITGLTGICLVLVLFFAGMDIIERLERIAAALEQRNKEQ